MASEEANLEDVQTKESISKQSMRINILPVAESDSIDPNQVTFPVEPMSTSMSLSHTQSIEKSDTTRTMIIHDLREITDSEYETENESDNEHELDPEVDNLNVKELKMELERQREQNEGMTSKLKTMSTQMAVVKIKNDQLNQENEEMKSELDIITRNITSSSKSRRSLESIDINIETRIIGSTRSDAPSLTAISAAIAHAGEVPVHESHSETEGLLAMPPEDLSEKRMPRWQCWSCIYPGRKDEKYENRYKGAPIAP